MPLLETKDLTMSFDGLKAIDGVNFKVKRKGIRGLIGPNGAGKTTLFNLITGVLSPESGSIYFKGESIEGMSSHKIVNKGISRTFQIVTAFQNLPVLANVMIPCQCPRAEEHGGKVEEKAIDALKTVGLEEKAFDPASTLSHGELKLLELARAISTRPELLLLDEPFSGLNPDKVEDISNAILQLSEDLENLSLVIIEHKLAELMKIADEVSVLHLGKIIAEGEPQEIAENKEVIEIYTGGEEFL